MGAEGGSLRARCLLLSARMLLPFDHTSVSSSLSLSIAFFPCFFGDSEHLHMSVGPTRRLKAFCSPHQAYGSGPRFQECLEGEKPPGCQGFSGGIWPDNSGASIIHLFSCLLGRTVCGTCLGFPGPGTSRGDKSTSTRQTAFGGGDSVSPPAFWVGTEQHVITVGVELTPPIATSGSRVPGDLWLS